VTTAQEPSAQPFTLVWARSHATPHIPQLAGSLAVFTQRTEAVPALQVAYGAVQAVTQAPAEQTCPLGQAVPHAPQFIAEVLVSVSQPLAALRSQSAKPRRHAPIAHAPIAHVASALANEHTRPQPPQFEASARRSSSQPLPGSRSQSPKFASQRTTTQSRAAQPFTATCGSMHTRPQSPQLAGSAAVLAQ
jgi:hypothetical protein